MAHRTNRKSPRRASSSQLARQWAMLRLLENRAYCVRELAEQLGVSKSSVQRDITTLQEHFMITATSVNQQKRLYRLERHKPPACIQITRHEIEALEHAIQSSDDDSVTALESLLHKVRALDSRAGDA